MTDKVSRFDAVKASVSLREYAEAHLERAHGGLVCPSCGSGTGPNGTPAFSIMPDGTRWHCFACGKGGDVFDLAGILKGTESRLGQLEEVEAWAGIRDAEPIIVQRRRTAVRDAEKADYSAGREAERRYIEQCRANIDVSEGMAYLENRGFTRDEIMAAGIGYDPAKKHVVIPFSTDPFEYYHIDRDITGTHPHKYEKPSARRVGPQPLHNPRALEADAVFIVEGVLDAMAVEACGYGAVALCGTSYRHTLNAIVERGYEGTVLLLLDNDEAGKRAQHQFAAELERAGIRYALADSPDLGGFKDACEALQADRTALKAILDKNASMARDSAEYDSESRYRAAMGSLRAIDPANTAADILTLSDYEESTPTGIGGLDRVLDGGLRRGVVALGAISSLGKTTLTVQMADHIAASGRGVLFVTIEQSAQEIVAKSLSRIIKQRHNLCVTTRMIMSREFRDMWNEETRNAFSEACEEYVDTVSPNLRILEGTRQPTVSAIAEVVRMMASHDGRAPIVFIDYLQLLAPQLERDTDKQATDKNMMSLRQLARDMRTTVFVISSLNRSSYSGTVSLDSFKESGGIEYGADVLLGLQPRNMEDRLADVKEPNKKAEAARIIRQAKAAAERPSEIVVLKQRNGITPDCGIPVTFLPACSLFIDGGGVQAAPAYTI